MNSVQLNSIIVPSNIVEIGNNAFSNSTIVTWLTRYKFRGNTFLKNLNNSANVVRVPERIAGHEITEVAPNAFSNFSGREVIIPSTVESIATSAFFGATNIVSMTLPVAWDRYFGRLFAPGPVRAEMQYMFVPSSLRRIYLNYGTSIPFAAFSGMVNLQNITLPENLQSIEQFAFALTHGIDRITIPRHVNSIHHWAFNSWTSFQTIEFVSQNMLNNFNPSWGGQANIVVSPPFRHHVVMTHSERLPTIVSFSFDSFSQRELHPNAIAQLLSNREITASGRIFVASTGGFQDIASVSFSLGALNPSWWIQVNSHYLTRFYSSNDITITNYLIEPLVEDDQIDYSVYPPNPDPTPAFIFMREDMTGGFSRERTRGQLGATGICWGSGTVSLKT